MGIGLAIAGTAVAAVGVTSMFVVSPLTGGAAQEQKCKDAQKDLDQINTDYKTLVSQIKNSKSTDPSEIIKYTNTLVNQTIQNTNTFNNMNKNKSEVYRTIQIVSLSIISGIIVLLFLNYYIFSIKIKN